MRLAPVVAAVRRHGDVLLGVLLGLGCVLELLAYPPADVPVAAPLGAVAGISLALRRRSPLVTFVVVFACATGLTFAAPDYAGHSVFVVAVFMLTMYSVGAHATGVEAWLGGLAVVLAVVGLDLNDGDVTASGIFFFVMFAGLPWAAGLVVRLRAERVGELNAANAALAEEARVAVADERARIARELHDVVSHGIAVTVLQARGARRMVGRDDRAVRQALDAIEATNSDALADMRRLLALLRTTDDDGRAEPAPGLDRLDQLVEHVRRSGLPVEVLVEGDVLPLQPGLDLSAFRIVQEALTNVLKHGGTGARAQVRVAYGTDDLRLDVVNTGRTDDAAVGGGHGLVGIAERVAVAGGGLECGPTDDGFAVRARLPYLLARPAALARP